MRRATAAPATGSRTRAALRSAQRRNAKRFAGGAVRECQIQHRITAFPLRKHVLPPRGIISGGRRKLFDVALPGFVVRL
jgi:hypothetical protein